jgi:hypothetical protein
MSQIANLYELVLIKGEYSIANFSSRWRTILFQCFLGFCFGGKTKQAYFHNLRNGDPAGYRIFYIR